MGAAASSRRRPSCKQACHQLSGPIQLFWKGQELLPLAASPRSDPGRRCRGRRLRLLGWSQLPLLGPGATLASCPCVRRPPPSFLCKEEWGWTGLCPDSCFCHLPGLPTWHCSPPRPPNSRPCPPATGKLPAVTFHLYPLCSKTTQKCCILLPGLVGATSRSGFPPLPTSFVPTSPLHDPLL